jgi:hypothetical protein
VDKSVVATALSRDISGLSDQIGRILKQFLPKVCTQSWMAKRIHILIGGLAYAMSQTEKRIASCKAVVQGCVAKGLRDGSVTLNHIL